jgi:DUF1365 family protein
MTLRSAIYRGSVVHERLRPKRHRLRYSVFSLFFDLDELPDLDRRFRLFAHNRFAPLSFYDRDHGPTTGDSLRPWVEERLQEAGIETNGVSIRLLCYPRIFGYVFNPLSVFFCYDPGGDLVAILYEVCNTFSERHTYVIPVAQSNSRIVRQTCRKSLYVSPFIDMDADYHFRILPPDDAVSVVIRQEDAKGPLLAACFRGERQEMDDRALAHILLRFPLLTVKIIAAIHWEALRMWLKGFRVFSHSPAVTPVDSSVGQSGNTSL